MGATYKKEEVAADNPLETPCAQISRRDSLKLSAASVITLPLLVSSPAATRSELKGRRP